MAKTFDERASEWDDDPKKIWRSQKTAEAMRQAGAIRPGMKAFEYGCGTGLLSFELKDELAAITLTDTSEGMLEVLQRKIAASGAQHMQALKHDLLTEAAPAGSFDLAYSLLTLHHVPDTDGVLRRLRDLLNPGGVLCIGDLDTEDGSFPGPEETVHHGFDRDARARQAEAAGFAKVRFDPVCELSKKGRQYPMFLMTAERAG